MHFFITIKNVRQIPKPFLERFFLTCMVLNKSESQIGDALASLICFKYILIGRLVTFVAIISLKLISNSFIYLNLWIEHISLFSKISHKYKNISYLQRSQSHKIPMLKNTKISRSNVQKYQDHNIPRFHSLKVPKLQSLEVPKSQNLKTPISKDP